MSDIPSRRRPERSALPLIVGCLITGLGALIRMKARDFANYDGIISGKVHDRWLEIGLWFVALGTMLVALSLHRMLSTRRSLDA